jgi:thioesterase domain-containing protein
MPDHSIPAAARRNVAAVRELQPHGPYAIAGYSSGSTIAFEMACQLRAAGEDVACLVILDRDAPGDDPNLRLRAQSRARVLQTSAPETSAPRMAVLAGRLTRAAVTSASAHAKRRVAFITAGWWPRHGYHQYRVFFRLNIHMARKYKPSSTFDGPTLVVRGEASDGLPPDSGLPIRPQRALADLGWSQFVNGPITVVEVPGDHSGLLRKPVVDLVAAHITSALDNGATARADHSATPTGTAN